MAGQFKYGSDGPADPETLGYNINHFALLVNDMEASKRFYRKVLGMREIFTYHASDMYEITYMGFSHGGENGTGFQTGEELFADKSHVSGLLELLSLKNGDHVLPSTKSVNTVSHIGLVVPDIRIAEARMRQYGVQVLKEIGVDMVPGSDVARAFGFGANLNEARAAAAGVAGIGFRSYMLVADPDGNLIEVQARK